MTGPSAVTVSLMDGAWKEVKRLPLGPSLSDAWWRFGGLIEVKVSSNRTKFPAVITKKIKGIAMWYEGTSKAFPSQPQYKTEEESNALSIARKTGIFVLGPRLSRSRRGSPTAHCVYRHLLGSPEPRPLAKWKHHLCNCFSALCSTRVTLMVGWLDMAGRHSHRCRKTHATTSSNVLSPFTICKLESWLFLGSTPPPPPGCSVTKASCAVCVVHLQWKYRGLSSTSYSMLRVP